MIKCITVSGTPYAAYSQTGARILIIIPAWNEEGAVATVIRGVHKNVPQADVLVVSDGSTDRTAQVAADAGATVLDLPLNLGVGGAMRAGYKYALRNGYQIAVQIDADGQHDSAAIPELINALVIQKANLVIGARFAGAGNYQVTGPRAWAMRFLSVTLSRITKTRLTDTTSGFKAADRRAIELFARDYPSEYLGDTVEALVIAARSGLKIGQIGVVMHPRLAGEPSHNPFKAALFLGRAVMALLIALTRPPLAGPHLAGPHLAGLPLADPQLSPLLAIEPEERGAA